MTTIAEFKQMLQQEINEPLDYPRVPGLSATELREYNASYASALTVVHDGPYGDSRKWVENNLRVLPGFLRRYVSMDSIFGHASHAAYTWALAELKALEPEKSTRVIEGWFPGAVVLDPNKIYEECVVIPRSRYNYLLDLERSVSEFTESFTRWEA